MALTSSTPRVTRSKRVSEGTGGEGTSSTSATSATATTTTVVKKTTKVSTKSKATIKGSSTVITNTKTTKSTRAVRTSLTFDAEANIRDTADHEKENIDPLTGLDPLQTLALKSGRKKGLGVSGRGGNVSVNTESIKSKLATTDATAAKTTTRTRKSRASVSAQEDSETIAGRLLAMRRREAPEDRIARELTVLPLVDLSEAYGITERPVVPSKEAPVDAQEQDTKKEERNEQEHEELSTNAFIAADLHAALRLLAQTTDEHRRLPTVLQRPARGVKRALDSPATSRPSRVSTSSENANALRRLSEPVSSSSRPTKRMRKSAPGTETPKFTSAALDTDNAVPRVPPNTPVRAPRALPLVTEVSASASMPIPIPVPAQSASRHSLFKNDEETQEESSFENTQGSSHFSSILGSFRLGTSFNVPSSLEVGEDEEREDVGGSWSRWL